MPLLTLQDFLLLNPFEEIEELLDLVEELEELVLEWLSTAPRFRLA